MNRAACILLLLLLAFPSLVVSETKTMSLLLKIGPRNLSTLDVEREKKVHALNDAEMLTNSGALMRIAQRTIWSQILDRAQWPAASAKEVDEVMTPIIESWEQSPEIIFQSTVDWYREQVQDRLRLASYIEQRLVGDRRRAESIQGRVAREMSRFTATLDVEILDQQWLKAHAPEFKIADLMGQSFNR